MNLRTIQRLLLTTEASSVQPRDRNLRVLVLSQEYEVVVAQTFCKRTSIIALRSCGEPDATAFLDEIWATPKRRAHTMVILAPAQAIYALSIELDRTSWEDAASILRRGGVMAFEKGRFIASVPCPRPIGELLDRHPDFDIDLD